ncbi:hypothetical protein BpHYR1_012646 [Brachionus plicatilis]|uniref:Uncharacterized protein n=1 Tax=Brachionus plicatilis TaxID=10195 RepID=A0A3M7SUR5_BRAPC|nr:hypothetical protein BpHYR1_012646 [Brachionus plicatilis]
MLVQPFASLFSKIASEAPIASEVTQSAFTICYKELKMIKASLIEREIDRIIVVIKSIVWKERSVAITKIRIEKWIMIFSEF